MRRPAPGPPAGRGAGARRAGGGGGGARGRPGGEAGGRPPPGGAGEGARAPGSPQQEGAEVPDRPDVGEPGHDADRQEARRPRQADALSERLRGQRRQEQHGHDEERGEEVGEGVHGRLPTSLPGAPARSYLQGTAAWSPTGPERDRAAAEAPSGLSRSSHRAKATMSLRSRWNEET